MFAVFGTCFFCCIRLCEAKAPRSTGFRVSFFSEQTTSNPICTRGGAFFIKVFFSTTGNIFDNGEHLCALLGGSPSPQALLTCKETSPLILPPGSCPVVTIAASATCLLAPRGLAPSLRRSRRRAQAAPPETTIRRPRTHDRRASQRRAHTLLSPPTPQ